MSMTVATRNAPLLLIFPSPSAMRMIPHTQQGYKNLRSKSNAVCCTAQDAEVITDAIAPASNRMI
jgi:hypothetical protein